MEEEEYCTGSAIGSYGDAEPNIEGATVFSFRIIEGATVAGAQLQFMRDGSYSSLTEFQLIWRF